MVLHKRKIISEQRRDATARQTTARSPFSRVKNKKWPDFNQSIISADVSRNPAFEVLSADELHRYFFQALSSER